MLVKVPRQRKKRNRFCVQLFTASLTVSVFFPMNEIFAEESSLTEEAAVKADTNETILNYLEGEDYIFAAERIPTNRWDTPANVHVITAQEIEDNHYQSVEEALRHINGLVIDTYASNASDIVMNGDARILLLIDGRRANNSQTYEYYSGKSDMTMIPSMKMIERIEIVKGGYSALYGTDALGGVVNIITKKGNRNETTIDLNTGSWHRHNYEFTNQGIVGKFGWFLSGGLNKSNSYNYKGESTDILSEHSDYDNNNFFIRMDNRFTERQSISFSVTHKSRHNYDDMDNGLYNNVSLAYNFKEGTSTPSWLRYFSNYKSAWLGNSKVMFLHPYEKMQGVEYQNGWELGRHKIIAGLEWHKNDVTDELRGYSNKTMNNKAFYFQDTMMLGNKWHVVPGARLDDSDKFGSNWSPKISANYRADDKTKVYASWGRVYRTPSLTDLYLVNSNSNRYGNEWFRAHGGEFDLHSEKGHTETIGAEHNFNENTSVALNFFQSKINDVIYWDEGTAPYVDSRGQIRGYASLSFPTNRVHQKRHGVEVAFKQNINDHFSYNLAYSHTKVDDSVVVNYFPQSNGYRLGLHYNNRGLRVNLLSVMASGLNDGSEDFIGYASNRYAIFDLNTSYDINEFASVYLKANNFTNQDYSSVSRSYHSPGRSFLAGATFRF